VARVEELVAAEIFTDLLGMAARLLREGSSSAAIVIGVAVLEDVMRRTARHRKISIRENVDDLATLNAKLAASGMYAAPLKNNIDQWAELRMRAEAATLGVDMRHDVERMLKGVRDFVNDHLF
jgi:hypothetical protein